MRRPARLIGPFRALAIAYAVIGIAFAFPRITDDGVAYFAETRSLLLDGDLDLANEYSVEVDRYSPGGEAGPRAVVPREPDGSFHHEVNLGIVVLQGPFLVMAHLASASVDFVSRVLGGGTVFSMDGFSQPYVLAVTFGANALVAGGLAILAAFLVPFVGRWPAIGGALAVWLGSMLFFWSTQRPAHAHAPLVFVECLFVVVFLARGRRLRNLTAWFVLGALWGLMVTTRPVTILYALVPLGYLVAAVLAPAVRFWTARSTGTPSSLRDAWAVVSVPLAAGVVFLAGSFLGRVPQIAFGHDLSLFGSGYYEETGYLTSASMGDPVSGLGSLLFDPMQGLVWWCPVVALGVLGLLAYRKRGGRLIWISALVWGAAIVGFVGLLDAPARFGGFDAASRHLVEGTPVYVIGVAGLLALARRFLRERLARRALGATIVGLVVVAVAWSTTAQIAGSIAPVGGQPPWERVATIISDPGVVGRLWYTPATRLAPEGRVFLDGQLAQAVLGADPEAALTFLAGTAWLVIVGLIPLIGGAWAFRQIRRRRSVARPATGLRPTTTERGAGRFTVWLPWLAVFVFLAGILLPAFIPPGGIRNGARVTFETWDGRTTTKPTGTVTGVTFGHSPSGNAVVVPPRPAPPDAVSPAGTISQDTFVDVGDGRGVLAPVPDGWDVVSNVVLSFGPTVDATASAIVNVGWAGDPVPVQRVVLGAEQLSRGTVNVPVPILVAGQAGTMLQIRVESAPGGPAPQVSVLPDNTLAYQLGGLQSRVLPRVMVNGEAFGPSTAALTLPENGSIEVDETGGRMRIGPWGPEQILRWSSSSGWLFPGPTTVPGSWGDSVAPGPGSGPLEIVLDAPARISAVRASILMTSYGSVPGGSAGVELSTDGVTFRRLASGTPNVLRRQVLVTGTSSVTEPTKRVWLRLDADSSTGAIGINAAWFDLDFHLPRGTVGSFPVGDVTVEGGLPGDRGVASMVMTAAAPTDLVTLGMRAWSAGPRTVVRLAGPVGAALLTIGFAVAAFLVRRRSRVAACGLVVNAAIWLVSATTLIPVR